MSVLGQMLHAEFILLRKMIYTFKGDKFVRCFCLPSEKGSTLKGKNLLQRGAYESGKLWSVLISICNLEIVECHCTCGYSLETYSGDCLAN